MKLWAIKAIMMNRAIIPGDAESLGKSNIIPQSISSINAIRRLQIINKKRDGFLDKSQFDTFVWAFKWKGVQDNTRVNI